MAGFLKKTLGLFVEFDESETSKENPKEEKSTSNLQNNTPINNSPSNEKVSLTQAELDKFEAHFEKIINDSNLPGPDYFEFWKTMETLEAHIPDEKARIAATFASLSIQGLTKQKLIDTANHYLTVLQGDKNKFEGAVNDKSKSDIEARHKAAADLDKKIAQNSQAIQQLTKEITEAQVKIEQLKKEVTELENKLKTNKGGYLTAYNAIVTKISADIQKIQINL